MNDLQFINYILEQLSALENIRTRNMFGGTTLYYKDKVMGLICENQFFLKPNDAAKALLGQPTLAPAYEGSKDFYLISDEIDNASQFCELINASEKELPNLRKKSK